MVNLCQLYSREISRVIDSSGSFFYNRNKLKINCVCSGFCQIVDYTMNSVISNDVQMEDDKLLSRNVKILYNFFLYKINIIILYT